MRFFLEGRNKQFFFDFLQGELELSLERLNKRNEEEWSERLDVDSEGRLMIGERFTKYRQDVISLRDAVEKHFSRAII